MVTVTLLPREMTWLRTHGALLTALCLSVALHILATVGTPAWFAGWQEPQAIQFNAVLSPSPMPASAPTAVGVKPSLSRPLRRLAGHRTPRPLPTPKSEAGFLAPENAIAVERPAPAAEVDSDKAGGDAIGKVADAPVAPAGPVAPRAAPELPPVVAEKPPPGDAPTAVLEAASAMELPSRVSISYDATTSIADGVARYQWTRDGDKYTFESTIRASGFFVDIFAGAITQQSTGTVTASGIEPARFTIRRGEREAETAEFMRETMEVRLSRGSESRLVPMPPNLQDTQSFLFQLAIEAAKLKTAEARLNIVVTNARGLNRYIFKKVGESMLETRLGPVETVHLVRETSEPRDSYEAWLSPKHYYLPVKLKFFVDRFPAELIATNITSTP